MLCLNLTALPDLSALTRYRPASSLLLPDGAEDALTRVRTCSSHDAARPFLRSRRWRRSRWLRSLTALPDLSVKQLFMPDLSACNASRSSIWNLDRSSRLCQVVLKRRRRAALDAKLQLHGVELHRLAAANIARARHERGTIQLREAQIGASMRRRRVSVNPPFVAAAYWSQRRMPHQTRVADLAELALEIPARDVAQLDVIDGPGA